MFTGIVEEIGIIRNIQPNRLIINAAKILSDLKAGDSIAVNGACLTVTVVDDKGFTVDIMPETMKRVNFSSLHYADYVNLERAMAANGRFGGHFVQGHVDAAGRIISLVPEGNSMIMKIAVPNKIGKYLVEKGFIAVDGISLTISECDNSAFSVSLVPYTRENTTLGKRKHGDAVNLEVDIIAKYIEKLSQKKSDDLIHDFLEG